MVDWRKWPKAESKVASLKGLPAWSRSEEIRKEYRQEVLRVQLPATLAAILVPGAIIFGLFRISAPDGTGPIATWIGIGGFSSVIVTLLAVARWGEEWSGRQRSRRVRDLLEVRGESVLGDDIVGVTYSDVVWRDPAYGDSWDWGALRLSMDRLTYVGRFTNFDLRPQSIQSLEIKCADHVTGAPSPRLFLTWMAEGKTETLIFELPYQRSRRRRVQAMEDLRERIERWRQEPLPIHDPTPLVTPLRNETLRPAINPYTELGLPAKLISGAITLGIYIACTVAITLICLQAHIPMNGVWAGVSPIFFLVWILLAYPIEKRLSPRWRYQVREEEEEPMQESSPRNLGEALPNEETTEVAAHPGKTT